MTPGGAWARSGVVLAAVLGLDQVTKHLVREGVARGEENTLVAFVKLVNVRNEGVAFGLDLGGQGVLVAIILVLLAVLVVFFARHTSRPLVWLPVGLLLGGALGNIVDRIRDGAVTDFVKVPAWPAFNVADVAITFGVLTLVYVLERRPRVAGDPRHA